MFRTVALAEIGAASFDEGRKSGGFSVYSYVIMPDHVHIITGGERSPSDTLRFLKGISARRVIGYLKEQGHESSLAKLRTANRRGSISHSLWQHHSNSLFIFSESKLMEKVNYIHLNPVRAGLAELPAEFRFSSARIWQGCAAGDEPLIVDLQKIKWKRE